MQKRILLFVGAGLAMVFSFIFARGTLGTETFNMVDKAFADATGEGSPGSAGSGSEQGDGCGGSSS